MRNSIFFLSGMMALAFLACNDNSAVELPGLNEAPPASSKLAAITQDRSEINDFKNMDTGSLRIEFNLRVDTVYGYKNKGSDTLYVEGDVIYIEKKAAKGVGTINGRWEKNNRTGFVEVPYVIDTNYKHRDWIIQAMKWWSDSLKIKFIEHDRERNFIKFVPSSRTASPVGMVGKEQHIQIASWATTGNIAHEIGHALGLHHEHMRRDRDQFVTVACADDINYKHAHRIDPFARDFQDYNMFSIMHYAPNDCLQPINPQPAGIPGQRQKISTGDFKAIRSIYEMR
jgi:hypothetical protein